MWYNNEKEIIMADINAGAKKRDLVLFFDLIGRTVIGERTGEEADTLFVKNPVVVNIVPQQVQVTDPATGQLVTQQRMALQLLPLFFREFLAEPEAGVEFAYNKKNITITRNSPIFDFKVDIQYEQITNAPLMKQQAQAPAPRQELPANDNKVIKLFDE
jgi:hypothetical protein